MKAQRPSFDRITTLPQTIIEAILCLLPTEEAARSSILSREWRYKWTTIPKLEFDGPYMSQKSNVNLDDMASERKNMGDMCKLLWAIHQVLLLRQGPIHEFTLTITGVYGTCFEIDQIILHLSRNHPVKKLTLDFSGYIPLSLFSLHQLTDLSLRSCDIKHKPIFNGFGSLTSLSMSDVTISREALLHLLSNCPSLKRLSLLSSDCLYHDEEITIMELFKCLPVIEHLITSRCYVQYGVEVSVPQECPILLLNLKYFCYEDIRFAECYGLPFVFSLIKCSPNLEKIKLEIDTECDNDLESSEVEESSVKLEEYSDFWLEHLNELEMNNFTNFKPTMEFVKLILARSPNLKRVILNTWEEDKNEELEMLKILLRAPKASPVEIIFENGCKTQRR